MNKRNIVFGVIVIVLLVGCGNNTSKQEVAPVESEVPSIDGNVGESEIPEDCVTWFDGCNTCSVGEPGAPMACTMMACMETQESYCMKYEDGSSDTPTEKVPVSAESKEQMVGNDKDEHGCIGSAGYTWSEEKQKCIRPWEEK